MADTGERKRRWDDTPASSAPGGGGGPDEANKAVKVEEGSSAGGGASDKAAEAAAAIAARLSSQYTSGGRQVPPPPPPLPTDAPPPPPPGHSPHSGQAYPNLQGSGAGPGGHGETSAAAKEGMKVERDRDREAGLFVEDIEINDLRNRYLLTKGPTQQQILAETGAAVLTKGVWYPDKSMATEKDPPLYLHITAESADKLTAGVAAVRALIDQEGVNLENRGRQPGGGDGGWGGRERRKWPEEKVPIELEPLRNFNIRAKTVGPAGLFVKFIQQETQTRVQIKGIGSGYIETETGRESDEPMHVHITGPDQAMIDKAASLARDLLEVVTEKHTEARNLLEEQRQQHQRHQQHGGQGGYGGQQMYGQPLRFGETGAAPYAYSANQYSAAGLTAPLPPGEAPPAPSADGSAAGQTADPSGQMSAEAYTAWWASLDEASKAYYTQYYAAYAQYTAGAAATPAAPGATPAPPSDAPPPPPPSDAPPPPPPSEAPPPPPPQGGSGTYGAVPPPPGL
ncbi:hypothetical protein JCM11251_002237 [Rhodosporidiobolus azoricus]